MRKRSQSAGTMSKRSARELLGWRLKGSAERYHKRLAEIDARIREQKETCSATYQKSKAALDAAVLTERQAVADAKADKRRAEEKRAAAAARLVAARAERKAKGKLQRDHCALDAQKLRDERAAEREHQRESERLERELLSAQPEREPRVTLSVREQREQVEADVPEQYRPLWEKVRRTFRVSARAEGRASLLEDFLRYAGEHPDEVASAQEEAVEREMAALERAERGRGRGGRGRRGRGAVEGEGSYVDDEVPF